MEKKRLKVYLQYPWKVSDSQYYKSIIENPPENIDYLNVRSKEGMIISKRFRIFNFIKRQIRIWTKKLNLVIPNSRLTKSEENFDLIHCAHCLSENKGKPWVADFESWWQMWISGRETERGNKKVLEFLNRKECKKIIAWTPEVKKDIEKRFPEVKDKIEVVTYSIPFKKFKKQKNKEIIILFISRYFFEKGGLHALEAFDRITKKNKGVKAIFISSIPREIKEKYSKNQKIIFFNLLPHEKIFKDIFPRADIFVYPGYSDSFGFTFVEALAFGLPIITVDGASRRYVVDEGKTGFIINRPKDLDPNKMGKVEERVIEELIKKSEELIKNKKLREKMAKNCLKEVKYGKFSINKRNKTLREIYIEALKS